MLLSFSKQVIQKCGTVLADQKPWPQHLRAEVVKPEITPVWGPAAQISGRCPWGKIGTVNPSCSSIVRIHDDSNCPKRGWFESQRWGIVERQILCADHGINFRHIEDDTLQRNS
jgi:hypothetical protein